MTDLEEKQNSENSTNILALENDDLNIPLEASKTVKKKKVLTERQLEVLSNARAKLAEKKRERLITKRLEQQAIEDEVQRRLNEYKLGLEDKVVKKAISIKKKQIKKEQILDEISDDETPMEKIKEIAKKEEPPSTSTRTKTTIYICVNNFIILLYRL